MLSDLLPYHRYIRQNAFRDIRHRYAGTGLGLFWHVISPLLQIAIYAVVFSTIMHGSYEREGVHAAFVVYLCSGMLPWVSFTEGVIRGTGAFQENAAYLKKLPIPGPVFVATAAATATIQLMISLAILVVFALAMGWQPTWTWSLLPVVCVLWQTMGFGLGLLLGTLNVFFRDISQALIVVLQVWMWSLPVVYTEETVKLPDWYRTLLPWNPPYAFLTSVRKVFLEGQLPSAWMWIAMAGWTIVMVAAGLFVYRSLRAELRDVL